MSKKLCKDEDVLYHKVNGAKKRYICTKCGVKSPKDKWCCKAEKIKR